MKRTQVVLWSGAVLYLVSWFLPVVEGGTTLARGGVPGWEAFRLALSPFWPYQGSGGGLGVVDLLGVVSALTNVWFILALAALAAGPERFRGLAFGGVALSAPVNAFWLLLPDLLGDLRLGYYAWLGAFVVLAVAAYPFFRETTRRSRAQAAA